MTDERKRADQPEGYEDFLGELSQDSAMKDPERAFMENIGRAGAEEESEAAHVGERVRAVREKKGLSLQDISQRTGIPADALADIEENRILPPLGSVIKLAKALEMKMGYFISGEEKKPYTIVRGHDRQLVSRYDSEKGRYYGYEYQSLAPHKKDRHMEPFLVTLNPSQTEEERSTHDGQEFIFVLDGEMEVRLGEEIHVLEPGDAIYYDSTVPHLVKCRGEKSTKILAVLYAEK